jgi:hypothetical protein
VRGPVRGQKKTYLRHQKNIPVGSKKIFKASKKYSPGIPCLCRVGSGFILILFKTLWFRFLLGSIEGWLFVYLGLVQDLFRLYLGLVLVFV